MLQQLSSQTSRKLLELCSLKIELQEPWIAPAIMCCPDLDVEHFTSGSDLARRFKPSTNLGKSAAFLGSTATETTAATLNFMVWKGCIVALLVRVPDLSKNWSMPTSPHTLPAGQSLICST